MYIIRANAKNNWYLGFANPKNTYNKITHIGQNLKKFAYRFVSYEDAEKFLHNYFAFTNNVQDKNRKFYKIMIDNSNDVSNTDNNVFINQVPCYFDMDAFNIWVANPEAFKHKNF